MTVPNDYQEAVSDLSQKTIPLLKVSLVVLLQLLKMIKKTLQKNS